MSIGKDGGALRRLRALYNVGAARELSDGQLLERFAAGPGEASELAFAALVERHGAMVLRVCRGVLADPHEAQDAFQATFLVLVGKARGLWVRESLGPWLHRVAYRTASCARRSAAVRRRHERRAASGEEARAGTVDDLAGIVHEEVERLPSRYRLPVVLCDLEGRTHEQAARHLGWPVGTVKSRLWRGRTRLGDRLRRRGLAPESAPRHKGPAAPVALALLDSTTGAALRLISTRGPIEGPAAALAREVLRTMMMTRWLKIASVALALGATASGLHAVARKGASADEARAVDEPAAAAPPAAAPAVDVPVFEVGPGRFRVTAIERGNLESSENLDVFCRVEGETTIIMILPEGTRVTKGQLVCELDSSGLADKLKDQKPATLRAAAAHANAKLAREVAEIAVVEYTEGIFPQELEALNGEAALAQSAAQKAGARVVRTRRARQQLEEAMAPKEKARTPADVVALLDIEDRLADAEQALDREKRAIERATARRNLLERYTRDKTIKELRGEVEKARSDELARQATSKLEKDREAGLETQIKNCKLYAPGDGIVVYASDASRPTRLPRIEIGEGVAVRERQKIFSLPDISRMRVNTKVKEAYVHEVRVGMPARVRVDAFPDKALAGKVVEVAPLPEPANPSGPGVRVYSTRVAIHQPLPGLRPGMSAAVEILLHDLDGVLTVPLSAVINFDGGDRVAVKKPDGGFELRAVTLGVSDDRRIEVKEGLKPGDVVAREPARLLNARQKFELFGSPEGPAPRPGPPR